MTGTVWPAAALLALAVAAGCGTPFTPATPPARTLLAAPAPPAAAAVLVTLPVRNADPVGYQREAFGPAWADVDRNGCDTRDDILARDLDDITRRGDGCTVDSGVLHDPYTGGEITFTRGASTSSAVQIDHVVSLADAWRSGANGWTAGQRRVFANSGANLLATSGKTNQSKGDRRADEWMPPDPAFRCRYAAIQVAVKAHPGTGLPPLTVSVPERDALAGVLGGCGGEPAAAAP